jgi:hypothetical protein
MSIASDVGGAIGLLIGLCGINLIEIILLAWDMAWGYGKFQVKRVNSNDVDQQTPNRRETRTKQCWDLAIAEAVRDGRSKQQASALQMAAAVLDRELLREQLGMRTNREVNPMTSVY